ncbi:la-related protein 6-like [Electrophorus electricus]|uniref:la-related protein 6-like n=1 Tax=Electrophorus electricus TaxID=8005 RepID=UPI0015D052B1|nr:la-related protein 6-like [Electrophorus electricus]
MDGAKNDKCFTFSHENAEDIDWLPLDAGLIQSIVSQIEHYLSDENLTKDAFLLKHVRRNKMGYVNIKLLTSFKKIKHLTKDWRVTAHALRHSSKLEVNEEGNKVRRLEPVPESVLFQAPSRLLLVWNFTDLPLTVDKSRHRKSVMETAIAILEPFGPITAVRVNRPGRELPPELQKYGCRYVELLTEESVLVEYEDLEGAGRAYHQLSQSEGGPRVLLVGKASKKKAGEVGVSCAEGNGASKGNCILYQRTEQLQVRSHESSACSSSESEFATSSPLRIRRFGSGQVCGSPRFSHRAARAPPPGSRVSPLLVSELAQSPDTSPELGRRNPDLSLDCRVYFGSPWVQKRKSTTTQHLPLEGIHKYSQSSEKRGLNGDPVPSGVLRLPYGPDGSRGFHTIIAGRRFHQSIKI